MNALVVGGGGREHALVWKIAQSPLVDRVYCAPGSDGMVEAEKVELHDQGELAAFAADNGVGLTVVGPEVPLCAGIVDTFRRRGLTVIGPDRDAAQLEGSKSFAKSFMVDYGIPTAAARTFASEAEAAAYVEYAGAPLVVKADGLAAGKGVVVAGTDAEALAAIRECFAGRFGEAGQTVVVEECLRGEEASIIALTDGKTITALASSQDHKAVGEGDTGPNTGGMGAYSPAPVVTADVMAQVQTHVLDRFLVGCQDRGFDYRGVIYAGVMVTAQGVKVLEFNVRFGDPETQAILPRLETDLVEALLATAERRLAEVDLRWSADPAVCVVMASAGYPGSYEKGLPIQGLDDARASGASVFHAGTKREGDGFVTSGGRVLGVTASGQGFAEAVANAYRGVHCIAWEGAYFRNDIAHRALSR